MKLEFDIPDGFKVEDIKPGMEKKLQTLIKRHTPRRPNPGRPPHSPELKRIRARGRALLKYFDMLRTQINSDDYFDRFQSIEDTLKDAIAAGNEKIIAVYERTQPWTRRR